MLALAPEHVQFWWLTLGLGLVVISAVILLLQLLVLFVKDIDTAVEGIWEEAGGVATQTATTWMLKDTVVLAGALRDEVKLHAEALQGASGQGRRR